MGPFSRTRPAPVVSGAYTNFRPYVRSDFERRCAHCLFPELLAGGGESFQIDHFRPRHRFRQATLDFYNLYWTCYRCNKFKNGKWPTAALEAIGVGFVDICVESFEKHYLIGTDGRISGLTESAAFTIDKLLLNSVDLMERRQYLASRGEAWWTLRE